MWRWRGFKLRDLSLWGCKMNVRRGFRVVGNKLQREWMTVLPGGSCTWRDKINQVASAIITVTQYAEYDVHGKSQYPLQKLILFNAWQVWQASNNYHEMWLFYLIGKSDATSNKFHSSKFDYLLQRPWILVRFKISFGLAGSYLSFVW
jgi:hypothetical protein